MSDNFKALVVNQESENFTREVKSINIRDQILKNSPNENKDFFVVPKVVE